LLLKVDAIVVMLVAPAHLGSPALAALVALAVLPAGGMLELLVFEVWIPTGGVVAFADPPLGSFGTVGGVLRLSFVPLVFFRRSLVSARVAATATPARRKFAPDL
jgi:hypothetical protein